MFHLFEFMDQKWLPESLRITLREILECGNSWPFRRYYDWVVQEICRLLETGKFDRVVELGAGTAPLTRRLAAIIADNRIELWCSDRFPDEPAFEELSAYYPNRVTPHYAAFDFTDDYNWPPRTLLCLSATLHHLKRPQRLEALRTLAESADTTIVVEPLRRTLSSCLFAFGSLLPSLCLPLRLICRRGRARRIIWCWLVPIAPAMFIWDGVISSMRMWSNRECTAAAAALATLSLRVQTAETFFCQRLEIERNANSVDHELKSVP